MRARGEGFSYLSSTPTIEAEFLRVPDSTWRFELAWGTTGIAAYRTTSEYRIYSLYKECASWFLHERSPILCCL